MPFINIDGKLTEVSQAVFDAWPSGKVVSSTSSSQTLYGSETFTPGQALSNKQMASVSLALLTGNPVDSALLAQYQQQVGTVQQTPVAAGGTVTTTPTATAQILTPNTTNSSPDQTLPVSNQTVSRDVSTSFGTTVQTFDDGTTLQTFDDGSVLATGTDGSVTSTPAPADDPQSLARAGLNTEQLALLGGADATDPFIRARLDLPPLSEVQTLSGAIGNINFGNIGTAISNTASSFGNAVSEFFTSTSSTAPAASEVDTKPAEVTPGAATGSAAYDEDGNLLPGYQLSENNDPVFVGGNADTPVQTTADTTVPVTAEEGYYQQFVSAFQQEQDAPTPTENPYAPVAAVDDTPLVEAAGTVTVEGAGAEFDTAVPIEIPPEVAVDEAVVPDTPVEFAGTVDPAADPTVDGAFVEQADGSFVAAEDLPVDPADDPTADGAFVETSSGVFQAAEDLPVDPANDPTVDGAFVEQADGSFAAAEDLPVDPATDPTAGGAFVEQADGSFAAAEDLPPTDINGEAASPTEDPNVPEEVGDDGGITDQQLFDNEAATQASNAKDRAQKQQTLRQQQALQTTNDWRVKLSLAKNSSYLYNSENPGILKKLSSKSGTDGVVFPYTPQISTNYRADYSPYTLTHSNYKGYFYNASSVDAVNLTATFTAQDTNEAEYLLAVIHFFRSVTKMFYGQDTQRGSPPPLVFLSGLGEYQFNRHPCVVSQFSYVLPNDVDYIRATSIVNNGVNFSQVRSNQSAPVTGLAGVSRLLNAVLPKGGKAQPPAPTSLSVGNPTYVPTKMDITLTLLPVQSRNQVSKVFSLSKYANGDQLKGGFW
jgi:hypothetical protein